MAKAKAPEIVENEDAGLARFNSSFIQPPDVNKAEMRRAVEKRTATDSESIDKRRIRIERSAYKVEKSLEKLMDTENPLSPGESFQTMNYAQITGIKSLLDATLLLSDIMTRHAEVELEDDSGNAIIDPLTKEPKVGIKRDTAGDLLQDIHDLLVDQYNLQADIQKQNGCIIGMLHDIGLAQNPDTFSLDVEEEDENGIKIRKHITDKYAPIFEEAMSEVQKKVVQEGRERVKVGEAVTQEDIDGIKK